MTICAPANTCGPLPVGASGVYVDSAADCKASRPLPKIASECEDRANRFPAMHIANADISQRTFGETGPGAT